MTEGLSSAERARANARQRRQYAKEDTLEVAIGTGMNLPSYPPDVSLTGIDLTPEMLSRARIRAEDLGMPVTLCEGDAQALPFPDDTFDTVLCTYSMCSVPDEGGTVLEMKRVLKPGGRLILVDHVRSSVAPIYWIQRSMELAPSRGERELTRRPITHVLAAGFLIEETNRSRAGMIERLIAGKP
jgi:ubiquinone/menaquinone biosynthesis C-methylase UbiE